MTKLYKFSPAATTASRPSFLVPRDSGRGFEPYTMSMPTIYFAGRMRGCDGCIDWRDYVSGFPGLYELDGVVEPAADTTVNCGSFHYGGPFLSGSGGGHTRGHTLFPEEHQAIWDIDQAQIERADLIVAYLEDVQAYGTLVELGYAAALHKPIALGFSDRMSDREYDELWFARMPATKVYVSSPVQFWSQVRSDWIGDYAR